MLLLFLPAAAASFRSLTTLLWLLLTLPLTGFSFLISLILLRALVWSLVIVAHKYLLVVYGF
ncbi:Hypothetical protein Bdt_1867 [Bdellovibrio bacteriovorus str. Tiberius]|uniref:Uncharacterized protein n=1 Tax=Bdellovibrio bacteriovorus str. Tiberius TaxID=1069642 RepID=K7ZA94_BDEBC|nr:Hypothetical protein Bdt_1867 [Bdellovibrio bacteriovorus str. Tiberius]